MTLQLQTDLDDVEGSDAEPGANISSCYGEGIPNA